MGGWVGGWVTVAVGVECLFEEDGGLDWFSLCVGECLGGEAEEEGEVGGWEGAGVGGGLR